MPKEPPHICVLPSTEEQLQCRPREAQGGRRGRWQQEDSGAVPSPRGLGKDNAMNLSSKGHVTGAENWRQVQAPDPTRAAVDQSHAAGMAGSGCNLGPQNEAEARCHRVTLASFGSILETQTPILIPECGCGVVSHSRCWKHGRPEAVKSDGVSIQLNATPIVAAYLPDGKKCSQYETVIMCLTDFFFSISQQVK